MKSEKFLEDLGRISVDSLLVNLDMENTPDRTTERVHSQCQKGFLAKVELELSYGETKEEANALFQDVHCGARPPVKVLRIVLEPL